MFENISNQKGMTLVEVLIALVVLSTISAIGWSGLRRYRSAAALSGAAFLAGATLQALMFAVALDATGRPHISYGLDGLKYARWTGSDWQIETVDSEGGGSTSLALDADGWPHISYQDGTNDDLKYARWTGSEWQIQTVDSEADINVGWYTSLALDTDDNSRSESSTGQAQGIRFCMDSVNRAIPAMVATVSTGYFPTAVSPDSMMASEPSSTAFATSDASARVGRGLWIIESSIWVAVMTRRPRRFAS